MVRPQQPVAGGESARPYSDLEVRARGHVVHLIQAVEAACRSAAIPVVWLYTVGAVPGGIVQKLYSVVADGPRHHRSISASVSWSGEDVALWRDRPPYRACAAAGSSSSAEGR
jgi:hypothetical protein